MEKALQEYARQRRATPGAPETLHGATRQLLQGEVKRVYGSNEASSQRSQQHVAWWFRWQGLASLGTAVVALCLGVIWWASQHSAPPTQLAFETNTRRQLSEELASSPKQASSAPPPPAAAPAPAPCPPKASLTMSATS